MISIDGNTLRVHFDRFDLEAYRVFLKCKALPEYTLHFHEADETYTIEAPARYAAMLGAAPPAVDIGGLPFAPYLFDDQVAVTRMALAAKRFAVWTDCGMGKTAVQLEWARHVIHSTGGRVLIITVNEVVRQTIDECRRFYGETLPIHRLKSRQEMREWCKHGYRGQPNGRFWERTKDGDPRGFELYRRHYSSKKNPKPKIKQFVGPGEKEVLIARDGAALFVWRRFIDKSGQRGVNCAAFRNESCVLSSDMIREAMEIAWERWPGERLYTYVNADEIRSTNPGYCFQQSDWMKCGTTRRGLIVLEAYPVRLAITNYEKMNPDEQGQEVHEMRHLAGICLDESSRLKTGGGKQKWATIKSTKGIPYKLSCTATPAPNDTMEFASQASFLEKMRSESEIIWTYFTRHPRTHRWSVKKHAREAFFRFMAGWSIYVRDPRRYGWRLKGFPEIPSPEIMEHVIAMTDDQRDRLRRLTADADGNLQLFGSDDVNTIQRGKFSQVAKGFQYINEGGTAHSRKVHRIHSLKPQFVADLIRSEVEAGLQVLVWTVFDAESRIIADILGQQWRFDVLTGTTADAERLRMLERFRLGESKVLISRASMLGYGMNFQHCGSMIFSGWSDSYEQWYQAIRRAYRYGQTRRLRVHIPMIPELEGATLRNVFRKQAQHEADIAQMESSYIAAMNELRILDRQEETA